jgi:hypothetical protein
MMKVLKVIFLMRKLFLISFLILFTAKLAFAQGVAVESFVDKPTISLDDQLVLTIRVKGGSVFTEPQVPNRGNFNVLSRGSSSNIEMINGRLSVLKEYTYVLAPQKVGVHEIGPISVFVEGVEYKTGPITVTVVAGEPSQPPSQQGQGFPSIPGWPSSPQGQAPAFPGQQTPSGEYKDIFVTAEVDNQNPYRGEQIIYTFRLYTTRNVSDAKLDLPDFHDFWNEEVQKENKYYKELGGKRYVVSEFRVALFPTTSGDLKIGETTLKAQVEEPLDMPNVFNDPFFTFRSGGINYKPRVLKTREMTIHVKELPSGAPPEFKGLVGNFKITSDLSKKDLSVGDSTTLTVDVSGAGNIKDAALSSSLDVPHLKIYEDKPALDQKKGPSGVSGTKSFKFALVPEAPGKIAIPPIALSYFDPKKGTYEKLSTPGYELSVVPGTQTERMTKAQAAPSPGAPVSPLAEDIATIHHDAKLSHEEPSFEFFYLILVLFAAPPVIVFAAYLILRRQRWVDANVDLIKKKKALARAVDRIKEIDLKDSVQIPGVLSHVIKEYLGDKLGMVGIALTPIEVGQIFSKNGKKSKSGISLAEFLKELDAWQYGGLPKKKGWEMETRKKAIDLLKGVEREM